MAALQRFGLTPGEAFEDAQALREDHPAGRGRRRTDQLAAIGQGEPQGLALHGAVVGQVVQRPDAAGRTYALDQLLCQFAAIEAVTAVAGESLQGLRQFRLAQQMTFGRKIAFVEKQPRTLGIVTQCGQAPAGALAVHRIHLEAVAGQGDGRRQGCLEWQATTLFGELDQRRWRAGNRRRQRAVQRQFALELPVAQIQVRRGGARRTLAGVEKYVTGRFGGLAQQKEATTAEPRAIGLDHGQRGAHRDGGVEGVAACFKDLAADFAGQGMGGGDGTIVERVGLDAAGQQQQGGEPAVEHPEQEPPPGRSPPAHHALPVMIRYFCISSSLLSTLFSSSGMQSTGQTCWHCGSS